MKSVLISIQPHWCELIASGEKALEVRKTRPKLETPFKCYIYCTKSKKGWFWFDSPNIRRDGAVIGEFICDKINRFDVPYPAYQKELDPAILKESCCTYYQLHRYAYHDSLYGWHISDLKIYDKPKALSAFCFPPERFCEPGLCGRCPKYEMPGEYGDVMFDCEWKRPLLRPPQSWHYVEEV